MARANKALFGILIIFVIAIGLICFFIDTQFQPALRKRHTEYIERYKTEHVLEAKKDKAFELGGSVYIAYGGLDNRHTITLLLGRNKQHHPVYGLCVVPGPKAEELYGDMDLEPLFGIPYILHVLKASPESIKYVATKNQ